MNVRNGNAFHGLSAGCIYCLIKAGFSRRGEMEREEKAPNAMESEEDRPGS